MTESLGSLTLGSSNLGEFAKASTRLGEVKVPTVHTEAANNSLSNDIASSSARLGEKKNNAVAESARTRSNEEVGDNTTSQIAPLRDPGPPDVLTRSRLERARLQIAQERHPVVEVLERWYGVVTEIEGDWFRARIASASDQLRSQHHEGEYPTSSVSEIDKDLFEVGAQFVFTVGRETRLGVQTTFSRLLFRRLPMWQPKEVITANEWAKEISSFLKKKDLAGDGETRHTTKR
jgi:hypothetical protein